MIGLLVLLFLVIPIAELYVIVQVAHGIGVPETILVLIAISVAGAWLTKSAGISVLKRLQRTVRAGKVPSAELVEGGLVLLAGALMITPGFLSDAFAVLLLLPPTRAVVRQAVLRRIRAGGMIDIVDGRMRGSDNSGERMIWDAEGWDDPPTSPGQRGLSQ